MPDTETLDVPLSGINPDLQLSLNSGKLTHMIISPFISELWICLGLADLGHRAASVRDSSFGFST
jgi:hypothetical protein